MADKDKGLNARIAVYKDLLAEGDIRIAYEALRKYMLALRTHLSSELSDSYSFRNVSPGYMDYTYFYFFDDHLRSRKLRFGIVLNHRQMRFELWLLGQNAEVQSEYWRLLKDTEWNAGRTAMPQYSVLEAVIVPDPDFDDLDVLTTEIRRKTVCIADEIMDYLKNTPRK